MFKKMVLGHVNLFFGSESYRLGEAMVDPGDVWAFEGVRVVLLTHAHFDHIYGLNDLLRVSPEARVYTNEYGREMLLDARKNMSLYHETPFVFEFPERVVVVEDGDIVDLDNGRSAKAVFTPGHNPSCITWVTDEVVFTGDAYIPGVKTVVNLPGGNKEQAKESERMIKELSIGRRILPGHPASE